MRKVAGRIRMLTTGEGGGFLDHDGPAYLVNGYFAEALPSQQARVSNVLAAGGLPWILERDRISAWREATAPLVVEGFDSQVDALAQVGDTLWVTSRSDWPTLAPGPFYKIELNAAGSGIPGKPRRPPVQQARLDFRGAIPHVRYLDKRGWTIARLNEDGLEPCDEPDG